MADKILLGTSGWSYNEWVGPFYHNDEESKLRAYTDVFGVAEIDSTFYAYPNRGLVMGWKMNTPSGFIFTAKLPKVITHEKKLDLSLGVEDDLRRFVDVISPLATSDKLGCLLVQLPPSFGYNLDDLEDFFKILPRNVRFAVEFRNLSWMREETWPLLERYGVAYTIVDEPLLLPEVHITTDFAYFRWHGRGQRIWFDYQYSKQELEPWLPRVKEAMAKTKVTYGFFNNHYHGYAVENCLQIMEMLGVGNEVQSNARKRIENYRVGKVKEKPSTSDKGSLDSFMDIDGKL